MERNLKQISLCVIVAIAGFFPPLYGLSGNAFQIDEKIWIHFAKGSHLQEFVAQGIPFQLWAQENIKPDFEGTLNTTGKLIGSFNYKAVPVQISLIAALKNGSIETNFSAAEFNKALNVFMTEYERPPYWNFKTLKLDKLNFDEETGFQAEWEVTSRFAYRFQARVPLVVSTKKVEDIHGTLKRYQDFIDFVESDGPSRIHLQNNKSGRPVILNTEGDLAMPVFVAYHPMHKIIWDEKKDLLRFEYLDVLSDIQKAPEIKTILKNKEIKNFVGADYSKIRVKGKGAQKEGFEILVFKPAEMLGWMIKLKGRKIIQLEEVKQNGGG